MIPKPRIVLIAGPEASPLRALIPAIPVEWSVIGGEEKEVSNLAERLKPQLAVIDLGASGSADVCRIVMEQKIPILVICPLDQEGTAQTLLANGATGYICAPCDAAVLRAAINNALNGVSQRRAADLRIAQLEESLELRKLVERAKGILMEQQGFSEDEAHRTLQKLSQEQSVTLKDFCRSLIQVKMVLGMKPTKPLHRK